MSSSPDPRADGPVGAAEVAAAVAPADDGEDEGEWDCPLVRDAPIPVHRQMVQSGSIQNRVRDWTIA